MLRDRGIKPREFRKLTYKDIARVQTDDRRRRLFNALQPKSFWEMCDTLALSYAEYEFDENRSARSKLYTKIYEKDWFIKTPIFVQEDIFEILLERGFQQEDALRVMEVVRRGRCCTLKLSHDEFMQLYDVPEDVYEVIRHCKYIPSREKVVSTLLDSIERAIFMASINIDDSEDRLETDLDNSVAKKKSTKLTKKRDSI